MNTARMQKRMLVATTLGIATVLALLFPVVTAAGTLVATNSAATAPGTPPSESHDSDNDTFYPYSSANCGSSGRMHFYTLDKGKESPRAFGPPATGTDSEFIDELFIRTCGDEYIQRDADPMLVRAIMAAVFWGKLDPNRPLDDGWREESRDLVSRIDWTSIRVERGRQSTPGTHSMYMYLGSDGVPKVGLVEVNPRTGTYLWVKVRTGDGWGEDADNSGWTEIGLRADCGFQPDFETE